MESIKLDDKTREGLLELTRAVNELQGRIRIVCTTVLNVKGIDGDYKLSPDCSELVCVESSGNEEASGR